MDDIIGDGNILYAFMLTLVAGLSTGIGALISLFGGRTNTKVLSGALGLSAGVMIFISFVDLLPDSIANMSAVYDEKQGMAISLLSFFGGILLIALIDRLVPEDENPHEAHNLGELQDPKNHHMKRTGIMLAMAIGIHNFPEGMATFVTAMDDLDVALPIVAAIAIHNVPEGIAVSVPIYQSTGDRKKAFLYSFLSGLAEPIGALVGILILLPFWSPIINSICLASVAGIMVYISFDELLPSSEKYGHHHVALGGIILGMVIMAGTLLIL